MKTGDSLKYSQLFS